MGTNGDSVDKEVEEILCELYAYVDEHRAKKEQDYDDDYIDQPKEIAHEEHKLLDQMLNALDSVRERMRSRTRMLYVGLYFGDPEEWHEPDDPVYRRAPVLLQGTEELLINETTADFPAATKDWGRVTGFGIHATQYGGGPEDAIGRALIERKPEIKRKENSRFAPHAIRIIAPESQRILDYLSRFSS